MATNKVPTNLKDRIAALEQRKSASPPTSPNSNPSVTVGHNPQSAAALRDKIARFERKGGVPVPRGSFGLGAPPPAEGPKRQGELYGNRIQVGGKPLIPQYTGGSLASIGSFGNTSQRRSVSSSVLTGNFDDSYLDDTPISSPTSIDTALDTPELSPTHPTYRDLPLARPNPSRGTSFHEALEFARKVEAAKRHASMSLRKRSTGSTEINGKMIENSTVLLPTEETKELVGPTPTILVSSDIATVDEYATPLIEEPLLTLLHTVGISDEVEVKPLVVDHQFLADDLDDVKDDLALAESTDDTNVTVSAEGSSNDSFTSAETTLDPSLSFTSVTEGLESTEKSAPLTPRIEVHQEPTNESNFVPTSEETRESVPTEVQSALHSAGEIEVVVDEPKIQDDRNTPSLSEPIVTSTDTDSRDISDNVDLVEGPAPTIAGGDDLRAKIRSQIPTPRARLTIQPIDSSARLSPPQSGFLSAPVSAGASFTSSSSVSSQNSVDVGSSEVTRALKMTPATGRGIPVFLPPTGLQVRKSDFIYLPPSPDGTENDGDSSTPNTAATGHLTGVSESDLTSQTFRAVVHRKVKETPVSATIPRRLPQTPMKNAKRATILQNPLSPGTGELATLLQEAMLLEDTLKKGELPGESPGEKTVFDMDVNGITLDLSLPKVEERQRTVNATSQHRMKRDMPTQGRLKHTFLVPLSKVRALQKQEGSIPVEQARPRASREDSRPKPDQLSSKDVQQKTPSVLQTSPSKIPKLSKFPSFKRFGSISLTSAQQEALRHNHSMSSEISSEDSNLVVTPPDNVLLEFGERRSTSKDVDQQSAHSQALSFSFPSLSPKKGGGLGRAASFAEKMWSRARTMSNGSFMNSSGAVPGRSTEDLMPQLPVLSELPSLSSVVQDPVSEPDNLKSSSSKLPPIPSSPSPYLSVSETPRSLASPASLSSMGSLPSPLFDNICDSFPSVPTDTPVQMSNRYIPRRTQGLTAAANTVSADFDSALLSSAIHLAARNKTST